MGFDEFVRRVAALMRLSLPDSLTRYDSLYEDVGLDSFQALELLIVIEGLAEVMVPPEEVPELFTLDDAFAYYETLLTPAEP